MFWLQPEESELFWHLGFYRQSKRPSLHEINFGRRQNVEQEDESEWWVAYHNRLQSLEADCLHLAAAAGVLSLPGLPQLHSGLVPWLWLVFHVAWEDPQGSLLRAQRRFPEVELRRTAATLKREPSGDSEGLLADIKAFLATPGGRYCSVLPLDPFTASAAMFDLASAVSPAPRPAPATDKHGTSPAVECYVTLHQMAAIVNRSKPTLKRLAAKHSFPYPDIEGAAGKPNEWRWSAVRPFLTKEFCRELPEVFPADRFSR
ncbi:MAG: hypothetical protein DCC67_11460 [Planctomycetota bacterium]|nr:MAG: hypothetical protein DCC67_11460 [Planctomycetota bacterium]